MGKLTGKGLAEHCRGKLGTPYIYGAKGAYGKLTISFLNSLIGSYKNVFTNTYIVQAKKYIGQICTDCSGLISWYTGKDIGSYQMYATAARKEPISTVKQAPIGAVLWKSGHVGVKVDDAYCIEAKGINYGTVKTKITDTSFTHWLLFDYIDYDAPVISQKAQNPYKEPLETICTGYKGEGVKWVQWELNQAGFNLKIDGDCGPMTDKAIRAYQQSCKITVDGKVGPVTRKAFKAD